MAITFIPPLGEQAVVVVVPVDLEQQHDIQVYFSAAFDSCDGLTLDDGLRVQIWSNFPAPGRAAGQWGDTTFEAGKAGSDDSVNLCLVPDEHFPTKGNTILHASFVVPASGQSHFAYTYRLVYPSGDIKWLGDYGRNGQLVLQRTSSPSPQRALSLASGWVAQSDRSYRWECTANAKGVKVGDVHSDVDQAIFAFGKDGSVPLLYLASSCLTVTLPARKRLVIAEIAFRRPNSRSLFPESIETRLSRCRRASYTRPRTLPFFSVLVTSRPLGRGSSFSKLQISTRMSNP
jgi:hypothetical protein